MQEADLLHQITFSVTWPPSTTFGVGAVAGLGDRAKARGAKRALLVTDAGLVRAGLAERVAAILRASGVDVHIFSEVRPNPTMAEVTEGVSLLRRPLRSAGRAGRWQFDRRIQGDVDAAAEQPLDRGDRGQGVDDVTGTPIGFIVLPSTAGTGSEATTGALVKDATGKKYLVRSVRCRPQEAILDPALTVSVPSRMTASTGMDAFIHALGAYTNAQVNPIGDLCAQEAIRLVTRHLPRAIEDGADLAARSGMMFASHLAGIAISMKGNDAIHGLSTAVESMIDCTHGESLSALMPHVLHFNRDAVASRYANIARLMGLPERGDAAAQAGVDAMVALRDASGTCRHLAELGVTADMLERLTTLASKGRSTQINCRRPSDGEIRRIYEEAL